MNRLLSLALACLLVTEVSAASLRNPYTRPVESTPAPGAQAAPPVPTKVPGMTTGAVPVIAPPTAATAPVSDLGTKLSLAGLRGTTALLRQRSDSGSTATHMVQDGQTWFFENTQYRVKVVASGLPTVQLLLDSQIVAVLTTREVAAEAASTTPGVQKGVLQK